MPEFIVWSTGAVRTSLVQRLCVFEEPDLLPYLDLSTGTYVTFPRADLPAVLNQLRGIDSLGPQ